MSLKAPSGGPMAAPHVTGRRRVPRMALAAALAMAWLVIPGGVGLQTPVAHAAECGDGSENWIPTKPYGFGLMGMDRASELSQGANVETGKGVVVAVVDSGIDASNKHLRGVVLDGVDLTGATKDGKADLYGHGTVIAGQIAAQKVRGSGVTGIAPKAKLYPVRVFITVDPNQVKEHPDQHGYGMPIPGVIADGIRKAADSGATIINVSISTPENNRTLREAVDYATAKGALVVASAGNRGESEDKEDSPRYPAAYPSVLSVAASNNNGAVTESSIHGPHVDVAAPGLAVLSSTRNGGDCEFVGNSPSTSYATAYASGVAALVAARYPRETPAQWKYRIEASAARINPDARDDNSGWGVVQPYRAIALTPDETTRGPASPFTKQAPATVPLPRADLAGRTETPEGWTTPLAIAVVAGPIGVLLLVLLIVGCGYGKLTNRSNPSQPSSAD